MDGVNVTKWKQNFMAKMILYIVLQIIINTIYSIQEKGWITIIPEKCNKCDCEEFYTKESGTQTGLYCKKCNKWIKWLSKKEVVDFNNCNVADVQFDTNGNIHGKLIPSIEDRLWRFVEFLNKKIDKELEREPLSQSDSIAKCSYSLALERDKNALINILNGREFHDMGE